MSTFNFVDYTVVIVYLLVVVALGLRFSGRRKSLTEYFHAGGKIPWWAVAMSNLATGMSPISYLAVPGWIFLKDARNAVGVLVPGSL